ncbi:hypothetical protein [Azospirillum argentinense]|uniref:Uncharacterized protein n=1 Tax=Azospirillum argentinense TaxID=2970906 RepID=A0A5B0KQ75_9PROT|nr:hypothetical protein [Azospirillum argentinense]KAA1053893.1 hypothetical protein FH063_002475 [Azospirillum argentinense]
MEIIEKMLLSAVAFAGIVVLRLFFKEFRDHKDPTTAMEEVLRRLFRRRNKGVVLRPPIEPTLDRRSKRGRLVTVFAEAAFDAAHKLGAWSVYARDGSKKVQKRGVWDKHIHTRDHASVEALSRGIHLAVEEFGLTRGDMIVAQSASEHAVDVLAGHKTLRDNRKDEAAALADVKTMLVVKGVILAAKHVHDPGGDITKRDRASTLAEHHAQRALTAFLVELEAGQSNAKRA